MNKRQLNRIFEVFFDCKFALSFNKSNATWAWHSRHSTPDMEDFRFKTALEAMEDATEPYFNPGE